MNRLQSDVAARPAAVAGFFYTADPAALRSQIEGLLDSSEPDDVARPPKMVIVPHAGMAYSGAVAARAYARRRRSPGRIACRSLIVVSSDLSHYLPYEQAQRLDLATTQQIQAMDSRLDAHQACGAVAINGALMVARASGLAPRLLDLRNSGDAPGDHRRVVGYAAFAFESQP